MATVTGESKRVIDASPDEHFSKDAGGDSPKKTPAGEHAPAAGPERAGWYQRVRSKVVDGVNRFTAYSSDLIGLKEARPLNRIDKVRIAVITAVTAIVAYGGGVLHAQKKPDSGVNELASGALHSLGVKDTSLDQFRSAKYEYDQQKNVLTVAQKENGEMKAALSEMRSREKTLREDLAKMEKRMAVLESSEKRQQSKIAALEGRLKRMDSKIDTQIAVRKAGETSRFAGLRSVPVEEAVPKAVPETGSSLPPKVEMLPKGQTGKPAATPKKSRAAAHAESEPPKTALKPVKKSVKKVAAAPVSYEKLQDIKRKVEKEMDIPGMEIRMREYSGGKTKLWVKYRDRDSKGFFSTTPKFASRLTEEGMKAWAKDRMKYLAKFDAIEKASKASDLSLGKPKTGVIEPQKIPYLEVSETEKGKARFLLTTPGGADMDFTVPLEDCTQSYLEPLFKKMRAQSEKSTKISEIQPAKDSERIKPVNETAPAAQVKAAEDPKADAAPPATRETVTAAPAETRQIVFSPIGPFGERRELKPIRGIPNLFEPSEWTGDVTTGQNPWFPGNAPHRFVPKIPEGVGVLGR